MWRCCRHYDLHRGRSLGDDNHVIGGRVRTIDGYPGRENTRLLLCGRQWSRRRRDTVAMRMVDVHVWGRGAVQAHDGVVVCEMVHPAVQYPVVKMEV